MTDSPTRDSAIQGAATTAPRHLSDAGEHARAAERNAQALHRYLSAMASDSDPATHPSRTPSARVSDVMTRGVAAAYESATFKEIVRSLTLNHISCVPVIDRDRRVIGVVSESDLIAHMILGPAEGATTEHALHGRRNARLERAKSAVLAGELMNSPAITVHPEASVAEAAIIAARARVRRLPVVDDNRELVGIVSRADLLKTYLVPDKDIAHEITADVIARRLLLDPAAFDVTVEDGRVRIAGEVDTPALRDQLISEIRTLDGVVELVDALSCRSRHG